MSATISILVRVVLMVPLPLLVGCVAHEVRDSARFLAGATHTLSSEGANFARTRTALAQARRANILMLERNATSIRTSTDSTATLWTMEGSHGKQRMDLFQQSIAIGERARETSQQMMELRSRHEAAIAAARSALNFRQAELGKVAKALASLSEAPSMAEEAKFLVAYFKGVGKSIQAAKEEAQRRNDAANKAMASTVQPPPR